MTADTDRAQVYAAELAAFDGTDLEQVVGVEALARTVEAITASSWWPGRSVGLSAMRPSARSSQTRCAVDDDTSAEIRIAPPQATLATAAHELAHALAGVRHGHDATFRRAHLDVVSAATNLRRLDARGDLHVGQLRRAYAAAGLGIGQRAWPIPPDVGGAIAL